MAVGRGLTETTSTAATYDPGPDCFNGIDGVTAIATSVANAANAQYLIREACVTAIFLAR